MSGNGSSAPWVGKVPITPDLKQVLQARRELGQTWDQIAADLPITGARVQQILQNNRTYLTSPEVYVAVGLPVPRATHVRVEAGATLFSRDGGLYQVGDTATVLNEETGERVGVIVYLPPGMTLPAKALVDHLPYMHVAYCEKMIDEQPCGRPFIMRAPMRDGRPWHKYCDVCTGRGNYNDQAKDRSTGK